MEIRSASWGNRDVRRDKVKLKKKKEFYFNLFLFRPFAILYCFGAYDALLVTWYYLSSFGLCFIVWLYFAYNNLEIFLFFYSHIL